MDSRIDVERHLREYKAHADRLFERTLAEEPDLHAQKQHIVCLRIVDNLAKLKNLKKKEKDAEV